MTVNAPMSFNCEFDRINNALNLSWHPPSLADGIVKYRIYYGNTSPDVFDGAGLKINGQVFFSGGEVTSEAVGVAPAISLGCLADRVPYWVGISAVNSIGEESDKTVLEHNVTPNLSSSEKNRETGFKSITIDKASKEISVEIPPVVLTNVWAVGTGGNSFRVNWDFIDIPNIVACVIYVGDYTGHPIVATQGWEVTATQGGGAPSGGAKVSNYHIGRYEYANLVPDTDYAVQLVIDVNPTPSNPANTISYPQPVVNVRTLSAGAPYVTETWISNVTRNSFQLNWDLINANVNVYEIYVNGQLRDSVMMNTYYIIGEYYPPLTPSTVYEVYMSAKIGNIPNTISYPQRKLMVKTLAS